ncbi:MAG: ABC transporter permease [Acidothermaceae bacterium]
MSDTLRAEWTKLRTAPGFSWLLIAAVAVTVGLGAAADAGARCAAAGCNQDAVKTSLIGVYLGQVIVAILAVTVIGSEYNTGMIRTTFAAMPRRSQVLAAKGMLVAASSLVVGVVGIGGSLLVARFMLPGRGFNAHNGYSSLSLSDAATARAALGSVLYLALVSLLSLGLTAAVRDSAVGIGLALGLLFVFPILIAAVSNQHWQRHLEQIAPMNAGLVVQSTIHLDDPVIGPWAGLGVVALWAAGSLILGGSVLRLRDA